MSKMGHPPSPVLPLHDFPAPACFDVPAFMRFLYMSSCSRLRYALARWHADSFASTVSTIAFAFYIQPIAMPMLREMPPGRRGYAILSWSMRLVIGGALHVDIHAHLTKMLSDVSIFRRSSFLAWTEAACFISHVCLVLLV
jgi:hypothetical protein